jgi:pimeloyl-ACP methyl ester carboxylesterase
MEHMGIARAHLVGISFGSTVALKALLRAPERFSKVVVQGAFAYRRFTVAERLALFLGRRLPGTIDRLPLRRTVLAYNSKMDFPWIIEDRWPFYLQENGRTPIRALAHRTSLVARLDLRSVLHRIDAKLLLVQGREDRIVPYRYFEELKAALPHSESVILPTVGHIPHITHAESLARVLCDWLAPCEPGTCAREPLAGSDPSGAGGPGSWPCELCPGIDGCDAPPRDDTPLV